MEKKSPTLPEGSFALMWPLLECLVVAACKSPLKSGFRFIAKSHGISIPVDRESLFTTPGFDLTSVAES